ncbi:NAD(P)/FAD-dependent oxidoreductase [Jannaschia aquimarina]|uniref:HcnC protein n=1 Tax=Jannaschia aquimarina TaxID=935700 RepID=A0A0D1ELA3_9RHOB|nr:FAD-dependent oxidoreductase [Jannaschia aquimarina]KIT17751.1 Hydrogen cyanide synthase subunit HcnC precursor [Jannaschia aquimarina]SNS96301.1 glycine oxidase [Jannaschia aquimarina]
MRDVTVRGAGIFGLSVAWACICRGARVRVIDPHGVGAGSSGGVVGALAPHVPENWNDKKASQLESLLMAGDWWRAVAEAGGGDPLYARMGRLQPVADEAEETRARVRAEGAKALWGDAAVWAVEPAPDGWGPGTARVIRDTLSARLHPARACDALAAAIRTRGGEIVTDGAEDGAVVHATGWRGLGVLQNAAGRPAGNGVKGQAALLRLDRRDAPQLYVDGLHIVPHGDGTTAIGSTSEREFDASDATDAQLDDLIERARAAVPDLRNGSVIARWAGVRPRARSRAPMLGAWPDRPGHWIANGGFKIGFGMAPLSGEVLADLILEGRDRIPAGFRAEASL